MSAVSSRGPVFDSGHCRCCGSVSKCLILTAEYDNHNLGKEIYSEMILDCFGLLLSCLDGNPTDRLICYICVCRLRDATAFKNQVLQCEEAFLKVRMAEETADELIQMKTEEKVEQGEVGEDEMKEEPSFLMFAEGQDDIGDDTVDSGPPKNEKPTPNNKENSETRTLKENPTTANTQTESHIKNSILETFKIRDVKIVIEKCDVRNPTLKINLVKNAKNISTLNPSKVSNVSFYVGNSAKSYSCDICDYTSNKVNALNLHLTAHAAPKRFQCDKTITVKRKLTSKHLKTHVKNVHVEEKPYECNICHVKYKHKSALRIHIRVHTGEKPFSCSVCDSRFSQSNSLRRHMATHTGQKPFSCDICQYRCTLKTSLIIHKMTHSGEKPYSCDICQFRCIQKSNLIKHNRIHSGEKPYSCDICQFRCIQKSNLIQHNRIHSGEKPFSCDLCQYRCFTKSSLIIHKRKHSREKPFSCDICQYKCIRKGDLKRHKMTHSGEKPFSCDICQYKCIQKNDLQKHKMTHSGEKPYSCDICQYRSVTRSNLIYHKKTHSGEKPYSCDICQYRCVQKCQLIVHKMKHSGEKP